MKQFAHHISPVLLSLTLLLASQAGRADVDPYRLYLAERGDISWQSLSPEEQNALRNHRGEWDNYSSKRQQNMRQGTQRYLNLPPEKRRELEQQRRHYEQLSPEERRRLREKYQHEHR